MSGLLPGTELPQFTITKAMTNEQQHCIVSDHWVVDKPRSGRPTHLGRERGGGGGGLACVSLLPSSEMAHGIGVHTSIRWATATVNTSSCLCNSPVHVVCLVTTVVALSCAANGGQCRVAHVCAWSGCSCCHGNRTEGDMSSAGRLDVCRGELSGRCKPLYSRT